MRAATQSDSDFVYSVHQAAMGPYVQRVWGWDERVQRQAHLQWFDPARVYVIAVDGKDVGVVEYEVERERLHINRIEIIPDHQQSGTGTAIIRDLIEEADRQGLSTAADVLEVNDGALRLYERLGFVLVAARPPRVHLVRPCAQ